MDRMKVAVALVRLARKVTALGPRPRLYAVIREFERVQAQYAGFGAEDTEPTQFFYQIAIDALKGKPWREPKLKEWQIFSTMKGWGEAAKALSAEAKKVAGILSKASYKEKKALADYMGWWSFD